MCPRTPPGWHRVHRRIGEGAEAGSVFVAREPTGEIRRGQPRDDDLILTRILTLDGLEEGVNRGAGCELLRALPLSPRHQSQRLLGRPTSHGCVRLANADVRRLFDDVREGDYVLITEPEALTIPDPKGKGRFPLRRARSVGHERAGAIPGDDQWTCERQ